MKIPLSSPDITEKEIESIVKVLRTPNLSLGPKLAEFETKFAEFIGTKYAVAVSSGTAGLHLCIKALKIEEGDGVITTPFSFITSSNCILYEGGNPAFVDINRKTLCIDVDKIEKFIAKSTNRTIKAILPVHIFGHPCEMDRIMEIADRYNLDVIEDGCEAIGAEYKNRSTGSWRKVGTFGKCGVFSFYPNKPMTTGEGGMIVTDDEKLAQICSSLRNQGREDSTHKRLGYNYRISDINSALGIVQLERLDEILEKREKVAELYNRKLKEVGEVELPYIGSNVKMGWFVYVVRLKANFSKEKRDEILDKLKDRGIECRSYFYPIHLQPFYMENFGYKRGDFPTAEYISDRTIALPFHNNLKEEEIDYIVDNLLHAIKI